MWLLDPYLDDVAPPVSVRKARFAEWVQRATDHAKTNQGLSIPKIADMAGIGNQTIYRWIKASGKDLPDPEAVLAFCDAIDVPTTEPFQILWPGKNEPAAPSQPILPMSSDLQMLMRKLGDPAVSDFDKEFIRETIRQLANRPTRQGRTPQRRRPGISN